MQTPSSPPCVDAYELRRAQQAYVAAGQNETFWYDKATSSAEALRAAIEGLRSSTDSAASHAALEQAIGALREFEDRDKRVRSYTSSGQRLLASDVIFSDGLEATARINSAIDEAAGAASQSDGATIAAAVRQQQLAAAAATGFVVLMLLLLARSPRAATGTETVQRAETERLAVNEMAAGLDLRPAPRREEPPAPQPVPIQRTARERTVAVAPAVEMETLAAVCTDLARLVDSSAMPALLERTAAALDASGLVVWVADRELKQLMPLAAHGYPDSVLSRMGTLPVDAENATAAAFRTGLLQTVSAEGQSNGAIAAPLLSPSGCLGVMSAEIRHDGEKHPARLAAAAIVAAQLATLVAPPVAQSEERTAAL